MEIILGMILLLQVLVSIQLMLSYKQVLQGFERIEDRLMKLSKFISAESRKTSENSDVVQEEKQEKQVQFIKKEAQEALINEVLSEVF